MHNKKRVNRGGVAVITVCLFLLIVIGLLWFFRAPLLGYLYKDFKAPTPTVSSSWADRDAVVKGDIYVSKDGSDDNDGSEQSPFLTIERALEAVAVADREGRDEIVVCIDKGNYSIDSLRIDPRHGGTENCRVVYTALGDSEVVLNAGLSIDPDDFSSVAEYPELCERLSEAAKANVYVLDLTKSPYNLTENDWGSLYPIGTYNTADRYSGDTTGPMYSELFVNGKRQSLARYPNSGYLHVDEVLSSGKDLVNVPGEDPAGDLLGISEELASRIASWSSTDGVWMYGFWKYDWADGSSPIAAFDAEKRQLQTRYQSFFGVESGTPYFFYNCLEELDTDNEWYLDRENGLLLLYSSDGIENDKINMSLSTDTAISVSADFVTLMNLTVTGTRAGGIVVNGNGNVITGCEIEGIGGHAIQVHGYDNLITKNEISGIGKGGISAVGGDRISLLSGNNAVENNLIHDWAEVYRTYQAGIVLGGVGNVCANNELFNSPHLAITYGGNNHVIEYNLIHDVCLETDDSGAIYAGRSWSSYGNDIRYNLIYDVGKDGYSPNGIYMDDAISGQNIHGNILVNIPKHAIFIGGGRDMNVRDNLIINSGDAPIRYDARARDGLLGETWFSGDVDFESGILWRTLRMSPWQGEVWQNAFPQYKQISDDIADINDPSFMANPAGSIIRDNVIFDKFSSLGKVDQAVCDYSDISENKTYFLLMLGSLFEDHREGDYRLKEGFPIYSDLLNDVLESAGRY